ncbi:MAG: alpha-L-rhamnosidase, partial [Saprospiraceae bacterium]|nr:alpha-L-rhamnosidase [Saprospiraceae bacterium]
LLEALFNAGESQYALDLITNDTKRGWLNMLRVGATMTTEAWDEYYKPNLTWNHAWGASPANIIVRKLFGIEPLEAGFSSFVLKPQPGSLKDLQIKAPTIRGSISCSLHVEDAQWNLHVSVPGNTTGYLVLPNPNKILVNDVSVIVENTVDKGIRLPAGEYEIICSLN